MLALSPLALVYSTAQITSESIMNNIRQIDKITKFPIGFWSYTNFDQIGAEAVKDYVDCGMTIVQTPRFKPGETKVEEMIAFLDSCHESGLKAIVCDNRCYAQRHFIFPQY